MSPHKWVKKSCVAHLFTVQNAPPWGKAGVLFREVLTVKWKNLSYVDKGFFESPTLETSWALTAHELLDWLWVKIINKVYYLHYFNFSTYLHFCLEVPLSEIMQMLLLISGVNWSAFILLCCVHFITWEFPDSRGLE